MNLVLLRLRLSRLVILGVVSLAFMAALPAWPVLAHASLLATVPAEGITVPDPPDNVRLEFNEPVSPLVMRLIDPAGRVSILTDVVAADNAVTIAAAQVTRARGTYTLSWRVVSADGHPVGGVVSFAVGHPTAGVAAPAAEGALPLHLAIWAVQMVLFIGLFVGVGGAAFAAWLAAERSSRADSGLTMLLIGGIVAAVLSLPLQGLDALAEPLPDVWRPAVSAAGFHTAWGTTVIIVTVTLIVALVVIRLRDQSSARALAVLALAGAGLAFVTSGHASTTPPRSVTVPVVFLHVLCIAAWVGSLLPLAAALRAGDRIALRRFSRLIPVPLVVLIVTGLILTFKELDRPDALWTTSYGIVLSAKIAVVLFILALAALNRYALVPKLADRGAPDRLITVIGIEFALALLILGLAGLWRFTTPPIALAAAEPTYIHLHGEPAMAQINVMPERGRGAAVSIEITDSEFHQVPAKQVGLALWNPSAGIEPVHRAAIHQAGADWRIDGLHIPVAGVWRMRVEILISDFEKVMLEDNVQLPRAP